MARAEYPPKQMPPTLWFFRLEKFLYRPSLSDTPSNRCPVLPQTQKTIPPPILPCHTPFSPAPAVPFSPTAQTGGGLSPHCPNIQSANTSKKQPLTVISGIFLLLNRQLQLPVPVLTVWTGLLWTFLRIPVCRAKQTYCFYRPPHPADRTD